jgi:hypothetical protein
MFYDATDRDDGSLTRHDIWRTLMATPDLANSPRRLDRLRASWRVVVERLWHDKQEVGP